MKDDIVKRLRNREGVFVGGQLTALQGPLINPDGPEAADEIERLRGENDRLGRMLADLSQHCTDKEVADTVRRHR